MRLRSFLHRRDFASPTLVAELVELCSTSGELLALRFIHPFEANVRIRARRHLADRSGQDNVPALWPIARVTPPCPASGHRELLRISLRGPQLGMLATIAIFLVQPVHPARVAARLGLRVLREER